MSTLADRTIASLSEHHDRLAEVVGALAPDQLVGPSGASEWRLCDVLSHLGSGAEIMLGTLRGTPVDNQAVWARWDAATPQEQAAGFVEHDARLVEALDELDDAARDQRTFDLGFLPEPVPLVVVSGMRLNEVANHAWDVEVGLDPEATVDRDAAEILLEQYAGPLSFLLGFSAKPEALPEPAVVAVRRHGLVIEDSVSLVTEDPVAPTAHLLAEPETVVRLLSGRLAPSHTPDDVAVSGNVTLEDLLTVFPGY
jgi:uncharacterized protein (TIGR03083 family)